jgi:hypothetical protein
MNESWTVKEPVSFPDCTIPPLRYEFLRTKPLPLSVTTIVRQLTTFESMVTLAVLMVHDPVQVAIDDAGALGPVLDGPGKQPPNGSGPSGTFLVLTAHAPVGVGVGVAVGAGVGVGVAFGVAVAVAVGAGVAVGVGELFGVNVPLHVPV